MAQESTDNLTDNLTLPRYNLMAQRGSERLFREEAPAFVGAFEILGVFGFTPGGVGMYASALVITRRTGDPTEYTVHTLIRADEFTGDTPGTVRHSLSNGYYTFNLSDALEVAAERLSHL